MASNPSQCDVSLPLKHKLILLSFNLPLQYPNSTKVAENCCGLITNGTCSFFQWSIHLLCFYLINCHLSYNCHLTYFSSCKDRVMDVIISFCHIFFMNTAWRMSPWLTSGSEQFYFSQGIGLYLSHQCLVVTPTRFSL